MECKVSLSADQEIERIVEVKERHEQELLRKANVTGVGVGRRVVKGKKTDEPAIVVFVTKKVPRSQLREEDIIPRELEGFKVDVQQTGVIRTLETESQSPTISEDAQIAEQGDVPQRSDSIPRTTIVEETDQE